MKKLVTHNGGFHADDVIAYAILQEVLTRRGETWQLIRTRDPEVIQTADIVFDVGGIYDASLHRYDHHQKGRAGERENGVLYASAGLIWKHFGRELCSCEEVWSKIDEEMISAIDASDNGQEIIKEFIYPDIKPLSLGSIISLHTPKKLDQEITPEESLENFEEATSFVKRILINFIDQEEHLEKIFNEVKNIYEKSSKHPFMVLDQDYGRPLIRKMTALDTLLLVVYPSHDKTMWKIEAIRKNKRTYESRILAPESWRGLREDILREISGVSDVLFCHASGFLCSASSYEGALQLVDKILHQDK